MQVGKSGVAVPRIGFGATALADMPETYGYSVGEDRALATVRAILAQPHGFLDTSRNYGLGKSEALIGKVMEEPENFAPTLHVALGEKLPWLRLAHGLPTRFGPDYTKNCAADS